MKYAAMIQAGDEDEFKLLADVFCRHVVSDENILSKFIEILDHKEYYAHNIILKLPGNFNIRGSTPAEKLIPVWKVIWEVNTLLLQMLLFVTCSIIIITLT